MMEDEERVYDLHIYSKKNKELRGCSFNLYNSQLLSCERKIIQNAFSECRSESKEEIIQGRIRRANIKKENE